jgi:hypothetical protein
MSDFKSPTTLTQSQFASIARVDLVEWSDPAFQCQTPTVSDYFTGLLYGTIVEDSLRVFVPELDLDLYNQINDVASVSVAVINDSTLITANAFNTVEINGDSLSLVTPVINNSTLEDIVRYVTANIDNDSLTLLTPIINQSSLLVVVTYIVHEINVETLQLTLPNISSGTLL